MKILLLLLALVMTAPLTVSCNSRGIDDDSARIEDELLIRNQEILQYGFLSDMYSDDYYPEYLVSKGEAVLLKLCSDIERDKPAAAEDVYALTHAVAISFNGLMREFLARGSDIDTVARENIAADIAFILSTYGYDLDIEEAIAPRAW